MTLSNPGKEALLTDLRVVHGLRGRRLLLANDIAVIIKLAHDDPATQGVIDRLAQKSAILVPLMPRPQPAHTGAE